MNGASVLHSAAANSMTDEKATNPFKIGDRVVFSPSEHTTGWGWSSFDRLRLKPGDVGVVTKIQKGDYLYLDDGRGGFHWECFKRAEAPSI